MKFQIGNRVKIREDLCRGKSYVSETGREKDEIYCYFGRIRDAGKEAKVIDKNSLTGHYRLDIDHGDRIWTHSMLEAISFNKLE